MLRLLLYSPPSGPIFEVGDRISKFHNLSFLTIEKYEEERDSYWDNKIPEISMDTDDFMQGNNSSTFVRNPSSMRLDKALSEANPSIIDQKAMTTA